MGFHGFPWVFMGFHGFGSPKVGRMGSGRVRILAAATSAATATAVLHCNLNCDLNRDLIRDLETDISSHEDGRRGHTGLHAPIKLSGENQIIAAAMARI